MLGLLLAGALPAPSALATSTVPTAGAEATREANADHCGEVSLADGMPVGGCPIHVVSKGAVRLRAHVFGVESATAECTGEFEVRIDEDAHAYIFSAQRQGFGRNRHCGTHGCSDATAVRTRWHAVVRGDVGYAGFRESLRIVNCLPTASKSTDAPVCAVDAPFHEYGYNHQYAFGLPGDGMPGIGPGSTRCEFVGRWLGAVADLEIVNTDDLP